VESTGEFHLDLDDEIVRLALFNTFFYTVVASVIKFALGLWLRCC